MTNILRDPRMGFVWLAARLWVGWEFLHSGWEKTFGDEKSGWWGSTEAVDGFFGFTTSPEATTGAHPAVASWYADLTENVWQPLNGLFAVLIPLGELLVGLGLILGLFTMASAFFGALMNLNFMLAGSLATGDNPLMFGLELLLMFAGPAAYVYGVDRFALPKLKAAWRGGERPTGQRPAAAH